MKSMKPDQPLRSEGREQAAHRLLRKRQIISNVAAARRQIEKPRTRRAGTRRPIGQHQQEASQSLLGGFAAEDDELLLGRAKLMGGKLVKLTLQPWVLGQEIGEAIASKRTKLRVFDHVGRELVRVVDADAKEIPGKLESDDLAPAVGQQSAKLQTAFGDGEHALRGVTLPEQRFAGSQP